jgi:hypothetical protein
MMSDEERDRYSRSARSDDLDLDFGARSIYGANTRRGLVELTLGATHATLTPAKAREMAAMMLEAATAAEGDEDVGRSPMFAPRSG